MPKIPLRQPVPSHQDIGNNLLRALKPEDFTLMHPYLEPWFAAPGDILFEPGDPVNYVYFPCDKAMVSYRVVTEDGGSLETALVGCEGAVGGIVSNGRLPAYTRMVIQFEGTFYRLKLGELDQLKSSSSAMRHLFSRYADCLLAQIFQSTACNALHTIEQRTAKWLMAARARTQSDAVPLTQEQLAGLLGVGRSYVARVLKKFREEKVVITRRGQLLIEKPRKLEAASCRCNELVRAHFDEVLKGVYPE